MRFFHKFESINYNYFGLVNNLVLPPKKKNKFTKAIEYLDKYSVALENVKFLEASDKYKNKIWQCWFQGKEKMPEIIKKCTASVQKYHADDIIFIDNNNIKDFVDFPDYILEKHEKGIIPYANFSDMLRLSLLAKYGGVWVDSSIYLTGKIPEDILQADFFTFRSVNASFLKKIDSLSKFITYSNFLNQTISVESPYFIASKAGNEIVNSVLNLFFEYWKNENTLADYLLIDKFFVLTLINKPDLKNQFLNMPEYFLEDVLLMQQALFEKFDSKLYGEICQISPVHKLTHKNLHRNPYKDSFLNYILLR